MLKAVDVVAAGVLFGAITPLIAVCVWLGLEFRQAECPIPALSLIAPVGVKAIPRKPVAVDLTKAAPMGPRRVGMVRQRQRIRAGTHYWGALRCPSSALIKTFRKSAAQSRRPQIRRLKSGP